MDNQECIFLNYRRNQSEWPTGRLHDRLVEEFGRRRIFTDVDSIPPGHDFTKALETAVGNCRVLLAVIGRGWADARDNQDRRRLDNPNDWVRVEIESALRRSGVLVIPVLIDGAELPQATELPGELAQLSTRQAVTITASEFARDVETLVSALREVFGPRGSSGIFDRPAPLRDSAAPPPAAGPVPMPRPAPKPPIAFAAYDVFLPDLQWSGPLAGAVMVEQVVARPGTWIKIGDPIAVVRCGQGPVTLWSTFIGYVERLGCRKGELVVPGRPVLTLSVSGWLHRREARIPLTTGVLITSGVPLGPAVAGRLLVTTDGAASRPVPWRATALLFVPLGTHVITAIFDQPGVRPASSSQTVRVRAGSSLP